MIGMIGLYILIPLEILYNFGFSRGGPRWPPCALTRNWRPRALLFVGLGLGLGQTFGDDPPKFSFEILIVLTQIPRKF